MERRIAQPTLWSSQLDGWKRRGDTSLRPLTDCAYIQYYDAYSCIFQTGRCRIRGAIASKYGRRRTARVGDLLHNATKTIVAAAVQQRQAIVLEDIRGIRALYQKGNGQGRKYRGRMNGLSFSEPSDS